MTHHDKDKDVKVVSEDTGVAGNKNPRDYRDADQARNFLPNIEETATVKAKDTKAVGVKIKKGKKKAAAVVTKDTKFNYNIESDDMREVMRCGQCLNPMTMSEHVNKHVLQNKKIPKRPDGKYAYRSPGVPDGQLMSPLCDDDEAALQAGQNVDFKHAVVVYPDGTVANVPVAGLA